MTDVTKVFMCSDANKAAVQAALVGVPGGGIDNLSIQLTTDGAGAPPANWWGGSGRIPTEMVGVFAAIPSLVNMYDSDGTRATFLTIIAAHNPALHLVVEEL